MTDERLILAIGRIERALSRLEAHAREVAPPRPDGDPDTELRDRFARLDARHARLRERTEQAVEQLGLLLGGQRREGGD